MLKTLFIQNYALIDRVEISFHSGFSVMTGETGAGKSIILGAIGLLLGQRADTKSIRTNATKCVVEASFDIRNYGLEQIFEDNDIDYSEECIIRREIHSSGKSRSFINDTPVSLSELKTLGDRLIDIHSQHNNLLINKENFQVEVLDIIANNKPLLYEYKELFVKWYELEQKLKKAISDSEKGKEEVEFLRYQVEQLSEAKLSEDEQEQLEQEAEILSNSEDIKAILYSVDSLFYGDNNSIIDSLKTIISQLSSISGVYRELENLIERIESSYIELKDVSKELSYKAESVEANPERLSYVNDRLSMIYSLQKKHKVSTVKELINILESFKDRLDRIDNSDEYLSRLKKETQEAKEELLKKANELTLARKRGADELMQSLPEQLVSLGMPNAKFDVSFTTKENPTEEGIDNVLFLFSANKNSPLQSISSVASGGEIARIMLTLKSIVTKSIKLPTIIFDEIDTGVSGDIAERMAMMMKEMGNNDRQVIAITHLPQIAAKGIHHYKVYKEDNENETNSHIVEIKDEERVNEIAYMLSGSKTTDAAIKNAKELMK